MKMRTTIAVLVSFVLVLASFGVFDGDPVPTEAPAANGPVVNARSTEPPPSCASKRGIRVHQRAPKVRPLFVADRPNETTVEVWDPSRLPDWWEDTHLLLETALRDETVLSIRNMQGTLVHAYLTGAPGRAEEIRAAVDSVAVEGKIDVLEHPLDDTSAYVVSVATPDLDAWYVEQTAHLCDQPPDVIIEQGCAGVSFQRAIAGYAVESVFGPADDL